MDARAFHYGNVAAAVEIVAENSASTIVDPDLSRVNRFNRLKRPVDFMLALLLLIAFAPAMIVIATAIRLDSKGPVLFRQARTGLDNRRFLLLKFRSMRPGSAQLVNGRLLQTQRDDPRITRIGRFLRRSSLDELPQLFNVLKGDMSLVGPRPHAPETMVGDQTLSVIAPNYSMRHAVRPGLTGLAQVNGNRGILDSVEKARERTKLDLDYVTTASLKLDLVILVRTVQIVVASDGAF